MKAEDGDYDLKCRTKSFALRIIKVYSVLPKSIESQVLGKQLLRSGTSVGAQYREAQRAKSNADFINKLEGSLQELEETLYWLELLGDASILSTERLEPLCQEANELISIFVTMAKNVKNSNSLRRRRKLKLGHPQLSSFRLPPSSFQTCLMRK